MFIAHLNYNFLDLPKDPPQKCSTSALYISQMVHFPLGKKYSASPGLDFQVSHHHPISPEPSKNLGLSSAPEIDMRQLLQGLPPFSHL